MLHLRLVVPSSMRDAVLDRLRADPTVCSLSRSADAVERPVGDLISCDLPIESVDELMADLKALGLAEHGAIMLFRPETVISSQAERAEELAPGAPTEAVIWDEVEARAGQEATLTVSFLALMAVAVSIAAVAVLVDSPILVVGAMVVGPDFGPLAAIVLGLRRRRFGFAGCALLTLVNGFAVGVVAAAALTGLLRLTGRIPSSYLSGGPRLTDFITHPDLFTVLVALLAGVAGMLSITQGRSGIIVGVLISVTTIPAAGSLGASLAMGRWSALGGSALQLGLNLCCLVVAGLATLAVQERVLAEEHDRSRALRSAPLGRAPRTR